MKEQKKNKGSVFVVESTYNAQNAQFGLLMFFQQIVKIFKLQGLYNLLNDNSFDCFLWLLWMTADWATI